MLHLLLFTQRNGPTAILGWVKITIIQPPGIHPVDRVVLRVGVGLPGLVDEGIDAQELPGARVVIAPY